MSEIIQMNNVSQERTVETVTLEIRTLHHQAQQVVISSAIEIGRRLVEVKAMLPHGTWGDYLKNQVNYSQSTANNFMTIFKEYGAAQQNFLAPEAKSQAFGNLSYSKALQLIALPSEEREEFLKNNDVDAMSTRQLQEVIRERDAAKQRAQELEDKLSASESMQEQLTEAENKMKAYRIRLEQEQKKAEEQAASADEELAALRQQLEQAKNAEPTEIIADPSALDAAAEAARKETEEKLQKKLDAAKKAKEKAEQAKQQADEELAALKASQEQALAAVEREKQVMQKQNEELSKQLRLASSNDIAIFNLYFEQCNDVIDKMQECIDKLSEVGDTNTAVKLQNALSALMTSVIESTSQ